MQEGTLYKLEEVEKLTGIKLETLKTRLKRKQLIGIKVLNGKKEEWRLEAQTVKALSEGKAFVSYEDLKQEWLDAQRSGYLTGTPIGFKGVDANEYGLKKFWEYLGSNPAISGVTSENLRLALSNVPLRP